jgi:acetyl-CoA decarbonylase/synthase complex subunit alpha
MRPNDTGKGRAIKLTYYIDLHKRLMGTTPNDIPSYVREASDVPITMKEEITAILKQSGWKERKVPEPTLLEQQLNKGA